MEMIYSRWMLLALACFLCLWTNGLAASLASVASSTESNEGSDEGEADVVPFEKLLIDASKLSDRIPFFYNEHNHLLRTELDMVFTMEQYRNMMAGREKRAAGVHGNHSREQRWTDNTLNYEILGEDYFSEGELIEMYHAFDQWSHYTCLKFEETSTERNRVQIQDGDGCYSMVGMTGGKQPLGLGNGCRYKRIILHELGHAIGLHHEQTRPDRDDHVTILLDNIDDSMEYNFDKYKWSYILDLGINYDYYSIMHYGKTAFSNNGQVTIKTKDRRFQNVIGRQDDLSFGDVKTVNIMYNCKPDECKLTDEECPGQGFVGKDCRCWCPSGDGGVSVEYCFNKDVQEKGSLTWEPDQNIVVTRCKDNYPDDCPTWTSYGYCFTFSSYMETNCKASCNIC